MKLSLNTTLTGRGKQRDFTPVLTPAWLMGAKPAPIVQIVLLREEGLQRGVMSADEARKFGEALIAAAASAEALAG